MVRALTAYLVLMVGSVVWGADGPVDPRFVGVWEMDVTNAAGTWHLTWIVADDGSYRTTNLGPGNPPGESGNFSAADGRYRLRASNRRTDEGSYVFKDADHVEMKGELGLGTWTRRDADAGPAPAAVNAQLPAGLDLAKLRIADLMPGARAQAAAWQADAILVEVVANAYGEGVVSILTPGNLAFIFLSPGTGQGLMAVPTRKGHWTLFPAAGPVSQSLLPIPEDAMDLVQAVAVGRKEGYNLPAFQASMRTWANVAGDPPQTAWMLVRPGEPLIVDARTGKTGFLLDVSGHTALQMKTERLRQGRLRAAGAALTFAAARQEADAFVGELANPALRVYRVDLEGRFGGTLAIDFVTFYYVTPGVAGARVFAVTVNRERVYLGGGHPFADTVKQPAVALPANLLGAEDATARLWALGPNVPPNLIYLQALCSGVEPDGITAPAMLDTQELGAVLGDTRDDSKPGQFIWRLIARKAGAVGMGKAESPFHVGYLSIDAVSGAANSARNGEIFLTDHQRARHNPTGTPTVEDLQRHLPAPAPVPPPSQRPDLTVEQARAALFSTDDGKRRDAIIALHAWGPQAGPAAEALAQTLAQEQVVSFADDIVGVFGAMGAAGQGGVKTLNAILIDPAPSMDTKKRALLCLKAIGPPAAETLPTLDVYIKHSQTRSDLRFAAQQARDAIAR